MCSECGGKGVDSESWSLPMSDEALVAIAQAGCQPAFAELFMRHQQKLFRTVQRITKNTHDTEDVLQDCSIKAFIHIKTFDSRSAFATWLVRIAINTALMMLRKRRLAVVASLDDATHSDRRGPWQIASLANNPEQELLEREKQFQIHQAVGRLPEPLRTVLEAHRFRDRPLKELATVSGLTVAATKSRLYRARVALRHSIERMEKQSFESFR